MAENPYQAPAGVPFRGSTRRIIGWVIVVLAAVLTARLIWIGMTWNDLYEEEFNRIVVLATFGILLMAVGCALLFSARRAAGRRRRNSL